MDTQRSILTLASLAGGSAILLAAAGAHMPGLAEESRHLVERAGLYQLLHAILLFLLALHWRPAWRISAIAFTLGILCFCGGIAVHHLTGIALPARIIPTGGIAFAIGWFALLLGLRRTP